MSTIQGNPKASPVHPGVQLTAGNQTKWRFGADDVHLILLFNWLIFFGSMLIFRGVCVVQFVLPFSFVLRLWTWKERN